MGAGKGGEKQCISNYSISNDGKKCESHLVVLKVQKTKKVSVSINIEM